MAEPGPLDEYYEGSSTLSDSLALAGATEQATELMSALRSGFTFGECLSNTGAVLRVLVSDPATSQLLVSRTRFGAFKINARRSGMPRKWSPLTAAGLGPAMALRSYGSCCMQQAGTGSSGQGRPKASGAALDGCAVTPLDVPQWNWPGALRPAWMRSWATRGRVRPL